MSRNILQKNKNMQILRKNFFTLLSQNFTFLKKPFLLNTKCTNKTYNRQMHCGKKGSKQKLLNYPVPPLEQTIPKFLKSVQPLLTSEEFEEAKCSANSFMQTEGAELQKLLEKVAKKEENWLAPRWLQVAYLENRDPVTVYSSPGLTFPIKKFENRCDYLMYTAKLIVGLIKFKKRIDEGKIPIVKLGNNELDNSQFGMVFGTCRIPLPHADDLDFNPKSKHVTIIHKNNFYKLPVYNKTGKMLHVNVLVEQLKAISESDAELGLPIGLLSTDKRDNWAKAYEQLMECNANCEKIQLIEKSLFTVSLDQEVPFGETDKYVILGKQLLHGGGTQQNSANRWMDKTIQLIVNPNGMSGFCYEHSPAEGQPIAMMSDYIIKILPEELEFVDGCSENYERFSKIEVTPPKSGLKEEIKLAEENINSLVCDLDLQIMHYKTYGKNFLKEHKLSPDSFLQVAFQYAFYKLHKLPGAQYESAHLRIYTGGRTETIRSCSNESVAFAQSMLNPKGSDEHRKVLMREAVNGHRKYTFMALSGQGVDRHLLGLKLMAIENEKCIPEFFSSKAFLKSSHYRVSTSQVSTPNNAFMCYGPAVKDGYACCYNPRKCDMFLACSSWKSNKETNGTAYAENICSALDDMRKLLIIKQK